jgi:diguanylate cyclase (GGDEF)-like protein
VASPVPPSHDPVWSEPSARRLRTTWRLLVGSFALLAGAATLALAVGPVRVLDLVILVLIGLTAAAATGHHRAVSRREAERRLEAEHVARILQGLSRSGSPDEIVEAIVGDLAVGTGADHTVVVRLRADDGVLEARLAGARPEDPTSITRLPLSDLDPDGDLEARVRTVFGLSNTIAAPLRGEQGLIGAIVLARRIDEPWSAGSRRILQAAAIEAAAALGRVASHRDAETRASTDALTGLPNRRYFDEFCALLAHRRRADDAVGVLMVDIDHFKRVNDRYGHDAGDEVLRAVAMAIGGAVRDGDVPARFGGEEFAVLLRNPSERVAMEVGERIRAAVGSLDLRTMGVPPVSVSVGVAIEHDPDAPIAEVVADADRALYRAKRGGRDRVVAA